MTLTSLNKYIIRRPLIVYILFLITGLVFFGRYDYLIKAEPDLVVLTDTVIVYVDSSKTHDMFLHDVAVFESNVDYRKVNRFGYLGKYQFGRATIKDIGIDASPQEFIDQPMLQEHAMELYLFSNKKQLGDYIGTHQFTIFRGIYITESGVLAAAHLGGAGSVKKFFKGGEVFKDGNGVPITKYMSEFSGYNLEFK
jgi:hypothetical protein